MKEHIATSVTTTSEKTTAQYSSSISTEGDKSRERNQTAKKKETKVLSGATTAFDKIKWIPAVSSFSVLILIILLILASRFRKRSGAVDIRAPYILNRRSRKVLGNLAEEIMKKSPLAWTTCEPQLFSYSARAADTTDLFSLKSIKESMLPTAPNASLRFKRKVDYDDLLQKRVQFLINFSNVAIVTTTNDASKVIAEFPCEIGRSSLYFESRKNISLSYKLVDMERPSANITIFKELARNINEHVAKIQNVLLFKWDGKFLPTDFDELLQVITFCGSKNSAVVSERRKELISVLHLFYLMVVKLKKEASLEQIFSLHYRNCNGSPLDRYEILYVLRSLLHWAKESGSIQSESEMKFQQWCTIYGSASDFAKTHPNILSIHPLHLTLPPELTWLRNEVELAHTCKTCILSERKPYAVMDTYHRAKIQNDNKKDDKKNVHTGAARSVSTAVGINSTRSQLSSSGTNRTSSKMVLSSTSTSEISRETFTQHTRPANKQSVELR